MPLYCPSRVRISGRAGPLHRVVWEAADRPVNTLQLKLVTNLLAPSRVPIPWCPRESPCVSLAVPPHCLWITLNSPRSCGPKRSNKPLILYVQYVQFCSKKATTAAAYPPAANGIVERNDTYINTEYNNNNNDWHLQCIFITVVAGGGSLEY